MGVLRVNFGRPAAWHRGVVTSVALALVVGGAVSADAASGVDRAAGAPPVPAAAANDGSTSSTAPDSVSASVNARLSGRRVEDLSQRSETVRVLANPDGTWTMESYTSPMWAKAEGGDGWVAVDRSLEFSRGGGVAPKVSAMGVRFADGSEVGASAPMLASLSGEDSHGRKVSLALGWSGALPRPAVGGTKAVYRGAASAQVLGVGGKRYASSEASVRSPGYSGADVVVEATDAGFSHSVVLNERPEGAVSLDFPLEVSEGLTPEINAESGAIVVRDAAGETVFYAPTPVMWDSRVNAVSGLPEVVVPLGTALLRVKGGWVVRIRADRAFLTDPGTVYPVTVDPSYTKVFASTGDTWLMPQYSSSQISSPELLVGTYDGGTHRARSFVTFNTSSLVGKKIVDAKLRLNNYYSGSCTGANVLAQRLTSGGRYADYTWSSQPSATSSGQGVLSTARGYTSSCPGGDVFFPVTPIVQAWADGSTNFGIRLVAQDETSIYTWRRYRSADYSSSDVAVEPHLEVTYNSYPNQATGGRLNEGGGGYKNWTDPATGYVTHYVNVARPRFAVTVSDPDGGSVRGRFTVLKGSTTVWDKYSGTSVASGSQSVFVPGSSVPALVNGGAYKAQMWAYDGSLLSKSVYDYVYFTVDLAVPATPTIAASALTNGGWADPMPASNTFTFASTSSDVTSFQYQKDAGSWTSVAAAGTPAKATLAWVASGSHTLAVKAVDRAGNVSAARTFTFGAGSAAVSAPASAAKSTDVFTVVASAPSDPNGAVARQVYWRAAGTAEPADFSATAGSKTDWTAVGALADVPAGSAVGVDYPWSAGAAAAALNRDRVPVLLDVQVCFTYANPTRVRCTWTADAASHRTVLRVPHAFGDNFPVASAGPGQVAMWTGEFNTSVTDLSVPGYTGTLSVSRSYSTFAGGVEDSVFGPGWAPSFEGSDVGAAGLTVIDSTGVDGMIALEDGDGSLLVYVQPGGGHTAQGTGVYEPFDADTAEAGARLEIVAGSDPRVLRMTDDEGVVTTWEHQPDGTWSQKAVAEPGSAGATTFTHDAQGRITQILAPVPPGVTCGATLNAGCRALHIEYAAATTAVGSGLGDVAGHVSRITYEAFNPDKVGGAGMDVQPVTSYTYDSSGKLRTVTDLRSQITVTYDYSGVSAAGVPFLTTVKPGGLAAWHLEYGNTAQGTGGVLRVTRDPASGSGPAVTMSRFVYGFDPAAAPSGLPDAPATVAAWGQTRIPTWGAATFGPERDPGTSDPAAVAAGDWQYANLSFTDAEGYTVNTAAFGAGRWLFDATEFDDAGHVVRTLDKGATALLGDLSADNGGTPVADEVVNAHASITRYNAEITAPVDITYGTPATVIPAGTILTPAGTLVTDTWAPATEVDGAGLQRVHTHLTYDEGAPNSGVNPITGLAFNLQTRSIDYQADGYSGSWNPGEPVATGEVVLGESTTGYAPIDASSVTGATSGWMLGAGTVSTTVMANTVDNIVTKTRYDELGRVVESRQPDSNGADAGTELTVYYTVGVNAADAACGGTPEWAGLTCVVKTAEASPTVPVSRTTKYSMLLASAESTEVLDGVTRTSSTTFLADGRTDTSGTTVTGLASSVPVARTQVVYDAATGLPTATLTLDANNVELSRVSTTSDLWGRNLTYRDTDGAVTSSTFDAAGRLLSVSTPGQPTVSYAYDGTDAAGLVERRGLATSMTIAGVGTFTGAFDVRGNMTLQTMPGGVRQVTEFTDTGEPVGLAYTADDGSGGQVPLLGWSQVNDVFGRVSAESTPSGGLAPGGVAAFDRSYSYDRAGRLTRVQDRTAGAGDVVVTDPADGAVTPCVTRSYSFDRRGNRLSRSSATSGVDGVCTTTGGTTESWAHDGADRVLTGANAAGSYTYDALGRQTVLPAVDTPAGMGAGNLQIGYFDTDLVASLTQNGVTTSFTLDPMGRRSAATTTTSSGGSSSGVVTRHYSDPSDNPGWVTSSASGVTSSNWYGSSLGGDLALTLTDGVASLTLADLHGDVATTVTLPSSGTITGIGAFADFDEYGRPLGSQPDTGVVTYGWLGGHERATDTTGLLLMGVRLFNPVTGLFTSVDPVPGGNSTAYAYPQDPINKVDLNGKWGWPKWVSNAASAVSGAAKSAWHSTSRWARSGWGWTKKNWRTVVGGAVFGACLVASAGACMALGIAAAAVVNTSRDGRGNWSFNRRGFATDAAFAIGGGIVGRLAAGRWGRSAIVLKAGPRHLAGRAPASALRRTVRNMRTNAYIGGTAWGGSYAVHRYSNGTW